VEAADNGHGNEVVVQVAVDDEKVVDLVGIVDASLGPELEIRATQVLLARTLAVLT